MGCGCLASDEFVLECPGLRRLEGGSFVTQRSTGPGSGFQVVQATQQHCPGTVAVVQVFHLVVVHL